MNVAVIGASDKPDRYSYKAIMLLQEYGHKIFPVHRRVKDVAGNAVFTSIAEIQDELDVVTMYVSKDISSAIADEIIAKNPKRIIFNPGAENPEFVSKAKEAKVETLNACTLVMLKTGQF